MSNESQIITLILFQLLEEQLISQQEALLASTKLLETISVAEAFASPAQYKEGL